MAKKNKQTQPKPPAEKRPEGRPSKYDPIYCEKIVEYFKIPFFENKLIKKVTKKKGKDGKETEEVNHYEEVATSPRFIRGFAESIGIKHGTLIEWSKIHPEFSEAYNEAKDLQTEHIVTCAIKGLYNAPFSIFTLKNVAGWRDSLDVKGDPDSPLPLQLQVQGSIFELLKRAKERGNERSKTSGSSKRNR